jgi:nucleoside 2-deoxyribosyltransferase
MRFLQLFVAFIGVWVAILTGSGAKAQPATVPEVYLAGPLGFSESGRSFEDGKITPELKAAGIKVVDPWHLSDSKRISTITSLPYGPERRSEWQKFDKDIGLANERAINHADAVVAVLDGPDVDSGTAAEIGFAYALHKPIVGYRGDFRLASDNEGSEVNLQVQHFIEASGGSIVGSYSDIPAALRNVIAAQKPSTKVPTPIASGLAATRIDVVTFFERVFGIVLALALAEAFKQSVAEGGHRLRWDSVPGLLSFLFLIFPFFQGMNRYFYFTYLAPNVMPTSYAPGLIFDGMAFTAESAMFFFMSRALKRQDLEWLWLYAIVLLFVDSGFSLIC